MLNLETQVMHQLHLEKDKKLYHQEIVKNIVLNICILSVIVCSGILLFILQTSFMLVIFIMSLIFCIPMFTKFIPDMKFYLHLRSLFNSNTIYCYHCNSHQISFTNNLSMISRKYTCYCKKCHTELFYFEPNDTHSDIIMNQIKHNKMFDIAHQRSLI